MLAQIPERGTVIAVSRAGLPQGGAAGPPGRRLAGAPGVVRRTLTVRNAGRIAAGGAPAGPGLLRGAARRRPAPAGGPRPGAHLAPRAPVPGATRIVVVTIRPGARQPRLLSLGAEVRAVAAPATGAIGSVRRP